MKPKAADLNNFAFPLSILGDSLGEHYGMTLRDYFAAAALTGCVANPQMDGLAPKELAEAAYETADAMLKARTK